MPPSVTKIGQTQPQRVAWTLPTEVVTSHYGVHPSRLPFGSYAVVGGIDASQKGVAHRMRGTRLWGNAINVTDFKNILEDDEHVTNWEDRGFQRIFPFCIDMTNHDGRVWGFVMWRAYNSTAWIYAKVETVDYSDEYSATKPEFTLIRPTEATAGLTFGDGIVAVVPSGRFLYILTKSERVSDGDAWSYKCYTTWFDWDLWSGGGGHGTVNDNNKGWVTDYFGVPPTAAWHTHESSLDLLPAKVTLNPARPTAGTAQVIDFDQGAWTGVPQINIYADDEVAPYVTANMTLVAGTVYRYNLAAVQDPSWKMRFHFVENGGAGPGRSPPVSGQWVVQVAGTGSMIEGRYRCAIRPRDIFRNREGNLAWNPDDVTGVRLSAIDNEWKRVTLEGRHGWVTVCAALRDDQVAAYWSRYQVWLTLSSLDLTQDPAENYYYAGEMAIDTDYDPTAEFYAVDTRIFWYFDGSDDAATTDDKLQCFDLSNAGNSRHDPYDDDYRTWFGPDVIDTHLGGIVAAIKHAGLLYAVQQRSTGLYLIWSDTRDFRYENFPVGNEAGLDFSSADNISFVKAGDTLFLLGTGHVYAIRRDGYSVTCTEILQGYNLVSQWAVATAGNTALVVCDNGVWALDGVSGTPVRLDGLDRLVLNRWVDRNLRSTIQLAYDSELDAIFMLCPGAAQVIILWLRENEFTILDGMFYQWVCELNTPDENGTFRKKAIFANWCGRFVEFMSAADNPQSSHANTTGFRSTSGGLYRYSWDRPLQVYVSNATTTTYNGVAVTALTLAQGPGGPAFSAAPNELYSGVTAAFLSGSRTGEIHQCWHDSALTYSSVLRIRGTLTDLATTVIGQWIAISPLPLVMVGAPFPGQTERQFHERKLIDAASFVVSNISDSNNEPLTYVPLLRVGVCQASAILGGEGVSAPSGGAARQDYLVPDGGGTGLPRWIDQKDSTFIVQSVSGIPTADTAEGNVVALDEEYGVSGMVLYPVVVSDVSGVGFDLLQSEFYGIITPSELNSAAG